MLGEENSLTPVPTDIIVAPGGCLIISSGSRLIIYNKDIGARQRKYDKSAELGFHDEMKEGRVLLIRTIPNPAAKEQFLPLLLAPG